MTNNENWKPVEGFPGYEVSDLGIVRSYRHNNRHNSRKTFADKPREIHQHVNGTGHRQVRLMLDGKPSYFYVHRLVAAHFIGAVEGKIVRHLNGDPQDNRVANLAIGTAKENAADRKAHGNFCNTRKLTEEDAVEIYTRYLNGEGLRSIHADFPQVTYGVIRHITMRRSWRKATEGFGVDAA